MYVYAVENIRMSVA